MSGTFVDRIEHLRVNVGSGRLTGSVVVDQRYAADQHWHDEYDHPDGGKAFYLRDPLYADFGKWFAHYGADLLKNDGNGGSKAMMDNMEELSRRVYEEAPWEFGDLRGSGHPSVHRGDEVLHNREPYIARISDEELKEKAKTSRLLDPHRYERLLG